MRGFNRSLSAAALVLVCGAALVAKPAGTQEAPAREDHTSVAAKRTAPRSLALVPSEWVIGQKVLDESGENRIGSIKDLILDASDGHVVYAIVNRAPRNDASPSMVAVPWLAFSWDATNRVFSLPMSRAQLVDAASFDSKRWDVLSDRTWLDETYEYFGVDEHAYSRGWSDDGVSHGDTAGDQEETPDRLDQDKLDQDKDARDLEENRPADERSNLNGQPDRDAAARDADADNRDDLNDRDNSMADEPGQPRRYVLASKVEGQTLRGAEDKTIGEVNDLVFDAGSGRMAFIVAQFGGFLGIGDSKVAVPWDYFKVNDQGRLYTNMVRADEVRTAPRIESKDWAELQDRRFGPKVYDHFGRDATWFETGFGGGMSDGRRDDMRDDMSAVYGSGTETEVTGTVSRVNEEDGLSTVVITTDAGDRLVHLAPASYLRESGCSLKDGDKVTVKGRTVMVDGRQVVMASSIEGPDKKTVDLRDGRGAPKWRDDR
jgi:sporulation protein YlmC with PRC-barrel domain